MINIQFPAPSVTQIMAGIFAEMFDPGEGGKITPAEWGE